MTENILSKSIAVIVSSLLLSACGGGGGGTSAPSKPTESTPTPVTPTPVTPTQPSQPTTPTQPVIEEKNYSSAIMKSGGNYWRDRGFDGTGVKVAVLDGGTNSSASFNNLQLVTNQQYGYNSNTSLFSKTNDSSVYNNIHGQQMAEVLAGKNNGFAPNVSLITGVISDVNGYTDTVSMHMGAQWAMSQNAKVINTSFAYGGYSAPDINQSVSYYEQQAQNTFKEAINKNVILVSSAGNSSENVSTIANSVVNNGWVDITKSGAKEHILIVGALDTNGNMASYSNFSGNDSAVQQRFILAPGYGTLHNGSTVYGTSPAAANVSGAASLMLQRWSNLGGKEVAQIMLSTANKNFSGYNPNLHGSGKLDMVAAFSPIGQTGFTTSTVDNKVSISQASISVPAGFTVSKSATVNVLDSYNRTFGIDASNMVQQEKQQTFTNMVEAMNGKEFEYSQNGVEVKSVNGELSSVTKFNGFNVTANTGTKYTSKSNSLSYLNDKSNFDNVSSVSRNYIGLDYKNGFYTQAMLSGNDLTGYTTGTVVGFQKDGMFVSANFSSGKMTNTLSGNSAGAEIGFKNNGFLLKGYSEQTNYQNTMLFNDMTMQKTGLLLSQEMNLNENSKMGFMIKVENGNGFSSLNVVDSVNADNSLNMSQQTIGFNQTKQELGLSYQNNNFTVMGLMGNMDNGLIIGYKNKF